MKFLHQSNTGSKLIRSSDLLWEDKQLPVTHTEPHRTGSRFTTYMDMRLQRSHLTSLSLKFLSESRIPHGQHEEMSTLAVVRTKQAHVKPSHVPHVRQALDTRQVLIPPSLSTLTWHGKELHSFEVLLKTSFSTPQHKVRFESYEWKKQPHREATHHQPNLGVVNILSILGMVGVKQRTERNQPGW